jgi:hypothetical protein
MFSSLQQSAEDIPAGEDKIVERRDGASDSPITSGLDP